MPEKTKTKKIKVKAAPPHEEKWIPRGSVEEIEDHMALVAPEVDFISTRYVVKIPYNDEHFKDHWKLRLYAAKLVERKLGDDVQLTSLKIHKPSSWNRIVAKMLGRIPSAKLYVTLKF
jgi:hypothetical protein